MTNKLPKLDFKSEFRIQLKRYLFRLGELSLGGAAAGLLLLAYSNTTLPGAAVASHLMEKLAAEIAIPDSKFLIVGIASCCLTLVLTGWPLTKPFRIWFATPYLKFCFDLAGTAVGVFVPVCISVAKPSEFSQAATLIPLGLFYLLLTTVFLWGGKYAISEPFQRKLQAYPAEYKHMLPVGAALVLLLMYLRAR